MTAPADSTLSRLHWKRLFYPVIYLRGREYYESGRVTRLTQVKPDVYDAVVCGERPYNLQINLSGIFPTMRCTCPYAHGGKRCKHMAAVFFAIENHPEGIEGDEEPLSADVPLLSDPEPAPPEDGDHYSSILPYFDLYPLIRHLRVPPETLKAAEALLPCCSVASRRIRRNMSGGNECVYYISLRPAHSRAETEVTIELQRDKLIDVTCDSYGHACQSSFRYGLCAHRAAALLCAAAHLRQNPYGDATDFSGYHFLQSFAGPEKAYVGDGQVLSLQPMVSYDEWSRRLNASFRILIGKKSYICKDIRALHDSCENHGQMVLGVSTRLDFSRDRWDENGQNAFRFIQDCLQTDRAAAERHLSYYSEDSDKSALALFGSRLDAFYDLCLASGVIWRASKKLCVLGETAFRPSLRIEPLKDGKTLLGVHVTGDIPEVILGQAYAYQADQDRLLRMDIAPVREWNRRTRQSGGGISMDIGRNYLPGFYRDVYPFLKQIADVTETEPDLISEWLPPECEIIFYLDVQQDDLTCRAEAVYGSERFSLIPGLQDTEKWRDLRRETLALNAALALFPEADMQKGLLFCGRSEDTIYRILTDGLKSLEDLGQVLCTDAFSALRIRRKWKLSTGVRMENGLMVLDVESGGLTPQELMDLLNSYQQKKKYHRLKNGDFIDLTGETVETLYSLMQAAHVTPREFVSGHMHLPAYRALYLDAMLREHEDIASNRDSAFRELIRSFKTVNESDFEAPLSLRSVLRPYQTAGFRWMMTLSAAGFGGILADDMGLGKTLQMIAVLLYAHEHTPGVSLIVCPASLVYNWQSECARFAPDLRVCVISGTANERREQIEHAADADLLVTSYDLLKRDVHLYEPLSFQYLVLDEAQYIKNASAAAARTVKTLRAAHRFALTGTPIENALSELWSIFDFLMPGFLYAYTEFRAALETPIVRYGDPEASARLKKMVSPFIMRRLKQDVLKDLPDKLEEDRIVMMDTDQRQLYDGQVVHLRQFLESADSEQFDRSRIRILAELTRLRQLCCDPSLTVENYAGSSCKREALLDLVREAIAGGHKMLVFSQFTSMLDLIRSDLEAEGIAYDLLTGATPKQQRLKMVESFNRDSVPVFLISLKAGGTGLNLTGADIVIHVDPWWNAAAQNQATDRTHRIGQTRTVTVFKLICRNTIEEKIAEMQANKSALAEEILSGENGNFASLSREDLIGLLQNG